MESKLESYDYERHEEQETGSHKEKYKIEEYPFDRYQIKIALTPDNKFLGILEITLNKDFLSHKQKMISKGPKGYHDIDEFYKNLDK